MRSLITSKPDRDLTTENVHIDYHIKFPLSVILALVLSIPWLIVATGDIPTIASIILVSVNLFANLIISMIIVFQWLGDPIDNISKSLYYEN